VAVDEAEHGAQGDELGGVALLLHFRNAAPERGDLVFRDRTGLVEQTPSVIIVEGRADERDRRIGRDLLPNINSAVTSR
jgi:hypothetical protein